MVSYLRLAISAFGFKLAQLKEMIDTQLGDDLCIISSLARLAR